MTLTKKKILSLVWLSWASVLVMQAAIAPVMRPYTIDLPRHILRFSLPEEIAREMTSLEIEKHFDPQDQSFIKNGFREIAGTLYDFKTSFIGGVSGSLKFHFMVQKKRPEYDQAISSIESLERYVRWWSGRIDNNPNNFAVSLSTLNRIPAVRRERKTFGKPGVPELSDLDIFSIPLDSEMFLDVGFKIIEWKERPEKESKWKVKAEALREAIKASVVLELTKK